MFRFIVDRFCLFCLFSVCLTVGVTDVLPGYSGPPTFASILINEVDVDTPGTDDGEFIELYDGGTGGASLDGLILVLFNGNGDTSYRTIDLDGFVTNSKGFFVVGSAGVANVGLVIPAGALQNGPDAVALYRTSVPSFPNGTGVTTQDLVDALVYDTSDPDDSGLLALLVSGQPQVDENGSGDMTGHSMQRVPDGAGGPLKTENYVAQRPTPGTTNSPEANTPALEIFEIQGTGTSSPWVGAVVKSAGNIVTAVVADGFFCQTPDSRDDAEVLTSNGMFVFTGSGPGVTVGDEVSVTGRVTEFYGLTEISENPVVEVLSSGNGLPDGVQLDADTPSPIPGEGICPLGLECFEAMRITIPSGSAASGTEFFGETAEREVWITASTDQPRREPGIRFPGVSGFLVWDGNPEIFRLNPDGLGLPDVSMNAGDGITASGVLMYEFGSFVLWPDVLTVIPGAPPVPTRARTTDEVVVGSLNMFRLFDSINDGGEEIVPDAEYRVRLDKLANYMVDAMGTPDVVAVQEVESLRVLEDLAGTVNALNTVAGYRAHLVEANDPGGIDVGFLVRSDVEVLSVVPMAASERFENPVTGVMDLVHDRPPLLLDTRLTTAGRTVSLYILNVHNRSMSGIEDPVEGPRVRAKRLAQAQSIASIAQEIQQRPSEPLLMIVGDFNAFDFSDGYVDVTGQIAGEIDPVQNMLSGPDLVNPDLANLAMTVPPELRYSFNFQGSFQALDHSLVNDRLMPLVSGFSFVQGNAGSSQTLALDAGTWWRASDHDGLVVFLDLSKAPQAAGITVVPTTGLETSESGGEAQFSIVLDAKPTAEVRIGIRSSDETEGLVSRTEVVFTESDWFSPQEVTVTGVDDLFADGDQPYSVNTLPAESTDLRYHGLETADVAVINRDNETDTDGDLIADPIDNCPDLANADQADFDGDGLGNPCDPGLDVDAALTLLRDEVAGNLARSPIRQTLIRVLDRTASALSGGTNRWLRWRIGGLDAEVFAARASLASFVFLVRRARDVPAGYRSTWAEWAKAISSAIGSESEAVHSLSSHSYLSIQPGEFVLNGNYPNPFNPETTISFGVPKAGPVRLEVFDLQGRLVRTLVDRTLEAGWHTVVFRAESIPSGQYLYRMTHSHGSLTGSMVLLK